MTQTSKTLVYIGTILLAVAVIVIGYLYFTGYFKSSADTADIVCPPGTVKVYVYVPQKPAGWWKGSSTINPQGNLTAMCAPNSQMLKTNPTGTTITPTPSASTPSTPTM